jgi:plastocyanin
MKWKILFAILAVMLLAGCSQKAVEKQPIVPVVNEQPVAKEVVQNQEQQPAEEVTAPVPTTETIMLGDAAAEPATLTVAAGSTIVFKNTGDKVKLVWIKTTEFSEKSPRLAAGDSWEINLPKAGEYKFLDIIIGKIQGTITVQSVQ